jgi:hypothetical protein
MNADFLKLRRRPFLLPLLMPLVLFVLVVLAAVWLLDARNTTILILVRNAEVEQTLTPNPGLNEIGKARVAHLTEFLARLKPSRPLDAIYAIQTVPAQETAAPIASKMGLAVNVLALGGSNSRLSDLRDHHPGEVVLVVASRERMIELLSEVSQRQWNVDESNYGAVFVVHESRLSHPSVIRFDYQ